MNTAIKTQIISSAIDVMSKAIKRLSTENECNTQNIQLVLKFDGKKVGYSYGVPNSPARRSLILNELKKK